MTDSSDSKGHDWKAIDSLVKKSDNSVVPASSQPDPLAGIEDRADQIKVDKLDLIGRFKAGFIERKAALAQMSLLHETQLDATRHALVRALDVQKQKVDLIAKKYIYDITEEHLRDLREMGIHNFQARFDTLLKLNSEVASLLKVAEQQDVPEQIRSVTVQAIFRKYEDFSARILAEETELK